MPGAQRLQNQHRIAKTIKAVTLAYGFLIRLLNQCLASERAHKQQQRGARQVKISNHRIYRLEGIAGLDKQTWSPIIGLYTSLVKTRNALQHSHCRRADGNDAATRTASLINQLGRRSIQVNLFAVHLMLANILTFNRPERIESHLQAPPTTSHPLLSYFLY